uniref:Large ribosomal subunit protein uL29c n=1 Tax=Scinaia undulata TaxID=1884664 RepID=A0A1G4NXP6_9FLOR|nr:Ribosomal protein L29 [Scinaia undulata]SCW23438.1 Ribosomal protein L29 [Scinaia undulata]
MNLLTVQQIRSMGIEDISSEIIEIKKTLFDFRMKIGSRQNIKPHTIKQCKRQLSQLMTIKHEKLSD